MAMEHQQHLAFAMEVSSAGEEPRVAQPPRSAHTWKTITLLVVSCAVAALAVSRTSHGVSSKTADTKSLIQMAGKTDKKKEEEEEEEEEEEPSECKGAWEGPCKNDEHCCDGNHCDTSDESWAQCSPDEGLSAKDFFDPSEPAAGDGDAVTTSAPSADAGDEGKAADDSKDSGEDDAAPAPGPADKDEAAEDSEDSGDAATTSEPSADAGGEGNAADDSKDSGEDDVASSTAPTDGDSAESKCVAEGQGQQCQDDKDCCEGLTCDKSNPDWFLCRSGCALNGQQCNVAKCCTDVGSTCYKKNDGWSSCNQTCDPYYKWEEDVWVKQKKKVWDCSVDQASTSSAASGDAKDKDDDKKADEKEDEKTDDVASTTEPADGDGAESKCLPEGQGQCQDDTDCCEGLSCDKSNPDWFQCKSGCALNGQQCNVAKCCLDAGSTCYKKNDGWSSCNQTCDPYYKWEEDVWVKQKKKVWDCSVDQVSTSSAASGDDKDKDDDKKTDEKEDEKTDDKEDGGTD